MVPRKRLRLSLAWIVPIAALAVGAALIARTVLQTGPTITITFRTAEGMEAAHTEVRFKEVVVGKVTKVEDDYAEVEIAQNVRVRVVKATLTDIIATGSKPAND